MTDIVATIGAIQAEVDALPDRALGGAAAAAARENVRQVANYLLGLHSSREALPRHAGKPSSGKVADAITGCGYRFNRQNFSTNVWCAKLLEAYGEWEVKHGLPRLDAAAAVEEAKQPRDKRLNDLEERLLIAEAEKRQLRNEIALLRGVIANTGRMP